MKVATWAAAIAVAGGVAVLSAYWFVSVLDVLFDDGRGPDPHPG